MPGDTIVVSKAMIALLIATLAVLGISAAISMQIYNPLAVPPSKVSSYSVNYTTGLALSTRISSDNISSGGNITVSVSVLNTLIMWNDLPPANDFPKLGSSYVFSMSPCSSIHYGFAVLEGNYSETNFNKGVPMVIDKPAIYSCPMIYHVGYYQFLPHSTQARLYSSPSETKYLGIGDFSGSATFSGHWTGNYQNPVFHKFTPGMYTVISADSWGQVGLLHFTVQ